MKWRASYRVGQAEYMVPSNIYSYSKSKIKKEREEGRRREKQRDNKVALRRARIHVIMSYDGGCADHLLQF